MKGQLVVENRRTEEVRLVVEPWADEYELAPKGRRTIAMTGPEPAEIEIHVEADRIVIWGWTGSVLNGDEGPAAARSESPANHLAKSSKALLRRLAAIASRRLGSRPRRQPVPGTPTYVSGVTDPREAAAELRRLLVIELEDDDLGLWSIVHTARYVTGRRDVQIIVLESIRGLLEDGLAVVGFPADGGRTFARWTESPEASITRIRREWDALGADPDIADVVWLADANREGPSS